MRIARVVSIRAVVAMLCIGTTLMLAQQGPALAQNANEGSRAGPRGDRGELHGTIAVHGCSIDPGDLRVRARPIDYPPARGHPASRGADRSFVVHAVPSGAPGAGGGDFAFAFEGLASGVPYRIGVKVLGRSKHRCPRLAWDVDRDPLVLAGDAPLAFVAYAVPSELEILGAAQGRDRETWVGADAVDFTDPSSATRQLRWRTSVPGATGGELQI